MGNRAVITTKEKQIGVYLHWNGGYDSITGFLAYCQFQGFRCPEDDNYGWARLTQIISNFFDSGLSVGFDKYENLDCNNSDNGVYIIEDWKIIGREFHDGEEQKSYDFSEMVVEINEAQPKNIQFSLETLENLTKNYIENNKDYVVIKSDK